MFPRLTGSLLVVLLAVGCAAPDEPAAEPTRAPVAEVTASPEPPVETALAATPEPEVAAEPDPLAAAAADDPLELVGQLADAHTAIRDPATSAERLELAGRLHQAATLQLVKHPEWTEQVLALLPEDIRETVRSDVEAGTALRSMVTPRSELPDWRIVEPAPAEELLAHYREAEEVFGVSWAYLAAIHLVETRMGRIRGTSIAGAQGPMQFMPATWDAYGEGDVNDDRDAILAAGRYLRASGAPGDMHRALFAYNRSDRYVRAVDLYAQQMLADPRAYDGYYHWQVYYLTVDGDVLLEVGYGA
jgi:hypothetical protein